MLEAASDLPSKPLFRLLTGFARYFGGTSMIPSVKYRVATARSKIDATVVRVLLSAPGIACRHLCSCLESSQQRFTGFSFDRSEAPDIEGCLRQFYTSV
jgi:hypothetical protein